MRAFVAAHDWLSVVQLPAYTPELNPAEGVWSHLKRGLGNLAACSTDPSGTYRGTGRITASIRQPDSQIDDRSVSLSTVTIRGTAFTYELVLGPECSLVGDGSTWSLDEAPTCTLRTSDGRVVSLRMIALTTHIEGGHLTLGGTCVSVREDGLTGSCLPSFSGAK